MGRSRCSRWPDIRNAAAVAWQFEACWALVGQEQRECPRSRCFLAVFIASPGPFEACLGAVPRWRARSALRLLSAGAVLQVRFDGARVAARLGRNFSHVLRCQLGCAHGEARLPHARRQRPTAGFRISLWNSRRRLGARLAPFLGYTAAQECPGRVLFGPDHVHDSRSRCP